MDHRLQEPLSVELGLHGRYQLALFPLHDLLEKSLDSFREVPLLQIVDQGDVVHHLPVFRYKYVAAELVQLSPWHGLLQRLRIEAGRPRYRLLVDAAVNDRRSNRKRVVGFKDV